MGFFARACRRTASALNDGSLGICIVEISRANFFLSLIGEGILRSLIQSRTHRSRQWSGRLNDGSLRVGEGVVLKLLKVVWVIGVLIKQ
jgi:hypothetical protein